MIKKSFIAFFVLMVAYSLFRLVLRPDFIVSQQPWQDNQIMAQQYMYEEENEAKDIVLLGSSMTCRIITDSLEGAKNMGLTGGAGWEGLELIMIKSVYPRILLLETNTIFRADDGFLDIVLHPILLPLRKYVTVIRDGYQPLPLLQNYLESNVANRLIPYHFGAKADISAKTEIHLDADDARPNSQSLIKESDSAGLTEEEGVLFERLKKHISVLEMKGTRVVFFEMPQSCENMSKPQFLHRNTILKAAFPKSPYIEIDCADYETSDGVHLSPDQALVYTLYLRDELTKLENGN